jgi:hypothetical protein
MDVSLLTVYQSPVPKIRLGKDNDGGYILADVTYPKNTILVSAGIGNDSSFEEAFIEKYSQNCFAFDGTITDLSKPHIEFEKKNVGLTNTDTITTLQNLIQSHNSLVLKMDIEGGEIEWLKTLGNEIHKFQQIIIVFHLPFAKTNQYIFELLNRFHVLIHFHPINSSGFTDLSDVAVPNMFECTYLNKSYFCKNPELNKDPIPSALDMKNVLDRDDITINYPPFVHIE